jgi:hypothetical protein
MELQLQKRKAICNYCCALGGLGMEKNCCDDSALCVQNWPGLVTEGTVRRCGVLGGINLQNVQHKLTF